MSTHNRDFSRSLLVGGMLSLDDEDATADDGDLESYMTDLSMTWTALRCNGGLATSVGREDPLAAGGQNLAHTPGTWSGA